MYILIYLSLFLIFAYLSDQLIFFCQLFLLQPIFKFIIYLITFSPVILCTPNFTFPNVPFPRVSPIIKSPKISYSFVPSFNDKE